MCRAVRAWRDCVVGQREALSSPRRRPRLDRANTAAGRRHGRRKIVIAAFDSRGARPVRFRPVGYQPTAHGACAVQCGLGVVVLWPNAGRGPPHDVRQGSTAPTPRQVGSTDSKKLWPLRLDPVARGPRAFRPVGYRPTPHGARAPRSADLTWPCCGLTAGRAPPHSVGRGSTAPIP